MTESAAKRPTYLRAEYFDFLATGSHCGCIDRFHPIIKIVDSVVLNVVSINFVK